MFCVGLTGNIGTGKSTVANVFKSYGAQLINADQISKELTLKDHPAYQQIVEHFDQSILLANGQINRKRLREIIFSQPEEKIWLEQLLHPLIRQKIEEQINQSTALYVIVEIPLHFNRDNFPYLDRVLLVTARESIQIQRIMQRDNCSKEQAEAMLKNQPGLKKRMTIADDLIENNGDLTELETGIKALHNKYQKFINS